MSEAINKTAGSMILRSLLGLVFLGLCGTIASADTYTFSLVLASGNISGPAGSTIGWGYSITNDSSTDWLVTTDLAASPFLDATPDASPFDYPIIAPDTTVTVPYDELTDTGLYALTWDVSAPTGFTDTGIFTLSADWYSGNPLTTGVFLDSASDETAAYAATVTATPEPGSLAMVILGIGGLLCFAIRLRGRLA